MDFADFITLPDSEKAILVEINIGDQIDGETWIQAGVGTNRWYINYALGTVNKVEENGVEYTERFTAAECEANANSFYYNVSNRRLSVHASGSDDPGGGGYTIIAYVWQHFTDKQQIGNLNAFTREKEALTDGDFEIWNQSATDLINWTEGTAGGTTSVNRESTSVYSGGYATRIAVDGAGNDGWITQNIILPPQYRCRLRFRYMHSAGGITSTVTIRNSASNVYLTSAGVWQAGATSITLANQTSYTQYELEFYAHASYTNYVIIFTGTDANSSNYFDVASLTIFLEDNYYLPYIDTPSLPPITQAVADYYIGGMTQQFGAIQFHDDGWWFPMLNNYLWLNKEVIIRFGTLGSDYEDFEKIFVGRVEEYGIGDTAVSVEIIDERATLFREIPTGQYWTADYPNLESGNEGKSIPILYGYKTNITPVQINTVTRTFKICGHQIQALNAVYDNGVLQTGGGVDYNADLPNGEFTFTHAFTGPVTCDATGKLCNWEDGTYSNNVACILWDLVVNESGINEENIDFESFLDLRTGRTQQHALYIDDPQDTLEIIRLLQASALFHFIPLLNGKFGAFRFKTETEGLDILYDEDYDLFEVKYEPSIYRHIRIKYNEDPTTGDWLSIIRSESDVSYKYKEEDTLSVETSLTVLAEAQAVGDWYIGCLENPPKKIETTIPTIGFNKMPSQRILVNKTRLDADGNPVTICSEEVYTILELRKSLASARVGLVGQDASQISELAHGDAHTDSEHEDSHTDSHTDGAHTDVHTDVAHGDTHSDIAHDDVPHSDSHADYHVDSPYEDVHTDHFDDPIYEDEHADNPHGDEAHQDSHGDSAHGDSHTDSHTDSAHGDSHSDEEHADSYSDSHVDVPHGDTHTDS